MVDRLRPQHGRHLPPQRASTSACTSCRVPEAVADAQDGDEFSFDPGHARARRTRRRARPTSPCRCRRRKTRSAGAAASSPSGRREFAASVDDDAARSTGPTPDAARGMTTTEQIVWAHRVDKDSARDLKPGDDAARLRRSAAGVRRHRAVRDPHLQPDHRRRHDLSAAGGDRQRSLRLHRQATTTTSRRRSAASSRGCTASRSRTTRRRATASSISTFPSRGS